MDDKLKPGDKLSIIWVTIDNEEQGGEFEILEVNNRHAIAQYLSYNIPVYCKLEGAHMTQVNLNVCNIPFSWHQATVTKTFRISP